MRESMSFAGRRGGRRGCEERDCWRVLRAFLARALEEGLDFKGVMVSEEEPSESTVATEGNKSV